MPSPVVDRSAAVHCPHGGRARPLEVSGRVLVEGEPVVVVDATWTVEGCPLPPPGSCTSVRFVAGAARVRVAGRPVVLAGSASVAMPDGGRLTVLSSRRRVVAS